MNTSPRIVRKTASAALGLLLCASLSAQTAPAPVTRTTVEPPPAETIVELSPFIVDTSNDRGYDAANTLSGSRLSTPSKYVGAAVAEITLAFMQDLSLTNVQDLIDFAPNSSSYNGGGLSSIPMATTVSSAPITPCAASSFRV